MISMSELFLLMHERGASDLHLAVGSPPVLRIDGSMIPTPFEKLTSEIPLKKVATPEEVAWVIAFLASERASHTTGATIPIEGGYRLRR